MKDEQEPDKTGFIPLEQDRVSHPLH